MLDKSCWRTEQRDAAQSPLEVPVVPFITVTIDTHTRTHAHMHARAPVGVQLHPVTALCEGQNQHSGPPQIHTNTPQ